MSALDILSFDSGAKRLNDWFQEVKYTTCSESWRLIQFLLFLFFIATVLQKQHKSAQIYIRPTPRLNK